MTITVQTAEKELFLFLNKNADAIKEKISRIRNIRLKLLTDPASIPDTSRSANLNEGMFLS